MTVEPLAATRTTSRWRDGAPWAVWLAALLQAALIGLAPVLFARQFAASGAEGDLEFTAFLVTIGVVVTVYATAGLLVTRRQSGNLVGWLMLVGGPCLGAIFLGYLVGLLLIESDPDLGRWFVLGAEVAFGPALFVLGPLFAAVFPDGRTISPRWGQAMRLCALGVAAGAAIAAVAPGRLEETIALDNPLGLAFLPLGLRDVGDAVTALALLAGVVLGPASLILRYRRASEVVRLQLKWFVSAGIVSAVTLPVSLAIGENWSAIVALVALGLVPIAVVVSVLRYRLYDIDTLIHQTLVYVPLVGVVAGVYTGLVALLQRTFTALTGDRSDAAAIISALVLAAVFTPIRNGIQGAVDRRFKPRDAPAPEATRWEDPAFRAAVEAIVLDVTRRGGSTGSPPGAER